MVEEVLLLCANAHRLYLSATPDVRRQLNQAVFARFWIVDDQVHGADLTEPFAQLLAPDLAISLQTDSDATTDAAVDLPEDSAAPGGNPRGARRRARQARRPPAPNATHVGGQPQGISERPQRPATRRNDKPRIHAGPGFEHPYSGGVPGSLLQHKAAGQRAGVPAQEAARRLRAASSGPARPVARFSEAA